MMMMTMLKKMKKRKHADLDAVNDGLDVVGLCAQLWLPYFCCPGSNAVAHGPYGFRANPHCLQVSTNWLVGGLPARKDSVMQTEACRGALLA